MNFISKHSRILIPVILAALIAALFFGLNHKDKAPDVTFTTIQGKNIRMADLRGKVVLVNFWATTCPGCIAEMPDLIKTYNTYHNQGFEVVAVAMSYDPPSQVLNYSTINKLPFPVMHDGFDEIATKFKDVRLTPTTFVLDQEGNVIRQIIGEINFNDLHAMLNKQLSAGKTKT